jgi:hypothetical protein
MAPVGGFGAIPEVARVAGNLLELRDKADDYDPEYVCDALEANLAIVGLLREMPRRPRWGNPHVPRDYRNVPTLCEVAHTKKSRPALTEGCGRLRCMPSCSQPCADSSSRSPARAQPEGRTVSCCARVRLSALGTTRGVGV